MIRIVAPESYIGRMAVKPLIKFINSVASFITLLSKPFKGFLYLYHMIYISTTSENCKSACFLSMLTVFLNRTTLVQRIGSIAEFLEFFRMVFTDTYNGQANNSIFFHAISILNFLIPTYMTHLFWVSKFLSTLSFSVLLAFMATHPKTGIRIGNKPSEIELLIFVWIFSLFCQEVKQVKIMSKQRPSNVYDIQMTLYER